MSSFNVGKDGGTIGRKLVGVWGTVLCAGGIFVSGGQSILPARWSIWEYDGLGGNGTCSAKRSKAGYGRVLSH